MADSGLYSADNVSRLSAAGVRWISRVPDTSTQAHAALAVADDAWQQDTHWTRRPPSGPGGGLPWPSRRQANAGGPARTAQGEERARTTLARQGARARTAGARPRWEKRLWQLSNQRFACAPDAQAALAAQLKTCPDWLVVEAAVHAVPKHA